MKKRSFQESVNEIESVLMDQIERLVDEPEGGFSKEELHKLRTTSDALSKLTTNFVAVNQLKLNVVTTAHRTLNQYNDVLGIGSNTNDQL